MFWWICNSFGTSLDVKLKALLPFFQKKKILITGASSGIGADLALCLDELGAELCLCARREQKLTHLDKQMKGSPVLLTGDVADREGMAKLGEMLLKRWGTIDIVIANAGVGGINPGSNFDLAIDRTIMDTNYYGMIHTFAPFIPTMLEQKKGHLVGVGSLAGFRGLPNALSYSASKSAQATFLQGLRMDLAPHGVDVTSIHPGFIKTPMTNHEEFTMPFMVPVRKSSLLILKAMAKKKRIYCYPWQMNILSKLQRGLPAGIYERLVPILAKAYKESKQAKIF